MNSFTTRPATEWTAPSTTYQVGSSSRSFGNYNTQADSTAIPYSSNGGGTTVGLTSNAAKAESISTIRVSASSRTSFLEAATSFNSYSASFTSAADPINNNFGSYSASTEASFRTARTEADTSRVMSTGSSFNTAFSTSSHFSGTYVSAGTSTATTSSSSTATGSSSGVTDTGPLTTLRTFSGTTSTFSTRTENLDLSTITTGSTDGAWAGFSTASLTLSTTTTTQASSTWTTTDTVLSSRSTTLTTGTASVTYQNHVTTGLTATTHAGTSYAFGSILQDTVFMMKANRGAGDYNRGEILWTFSSESLATNTTARGVFTDLFASTSADNITITDYRKFASSSAVVTEVSISSSIVTNTGTAGNTFVTRISTNGSYYSTSTLTTTSGTSTGTMTSADTTTTYSQSWSLGDIGVTISTYTSGATSNTLSSTIFTHTVFISGYETTSSAWTSGTSSSTWGFATSGTSTYPVYFSSASTTTALSLRSTTADSILFSSFTTTSTGTTTGRVTLGLVSTTTSRYYSTEGTFSRVTYDPALHSTASQFVVTDSNAFGFTTITRSESFNITRWTEQRLFPSVWARPGHDNAPALNEVRHKCHPYGFAGFGGSFAATAITAHLTTSQGLASGSTFTSINIAAPSTVLAVRGVSFFPVTSGQSFGGLEAAQRTSIISVPSVMTSVISIAATWTTTTTSGSTTAISSAEATHTIGVVSSITGEFWSSEAITANSTFRTEIEGGGCTGGFVAGDNVIGSTYQVLARIGRVSWAGFSSTQSTAGATSSTSATAGSVSFVLPASHAMVITGEPVFTAGWSAAGFNSIFSSAPHQPYPPLL